MWSWETTRFYVLFSMKLSGYILSNITPQTKTENIKFVPSIKSPKISSRETQKLGGQCKLSRGQGRNQGLLIASPITPITRAACEGETRANWPRLVQLLTG